MAERHPPSAIQVEQQTRAWELVAGPDHVVLRPRRAETGILAGVLLVVSLLLGLTVLVGALSRDWRPVAGVTVGLTAVCVLCIAMSFHLRRLGIAELPWLVIEKGANHVGLPRLAVGLPLGTVVALVIRPRGPGFSTGEVLSLRVVDQPGRAPATIDFYTEAADAGLVGGLGKRATSEAERLAHRLAEHLGVPIEVDAGDPRAASGFCGGCGYDLRGTLAAGRTACPECGASVTPAQLAWYAQNRETLGVTPPRERDERLD